MHRNAACLYVAALLVAVISASAVAAPAGPGLDEEAIEQRIVEYLGQLKDAETSEELFAARNQLISDYQFYRKNNRGVLYGTIFTKRAVPVLADLANEPQKQVNLGIAARNITEATISGMYYEMGKHRNPSLRYLAWQGFARRVWPMVLNQGMGAAQRLVNQAGAQLQKETDPLVVNELIRLLGFNPPENLSIPGGPLSRARDLSLTQIAQRAPMILTQVRKGQPQFTQAGLIFVNDCYASLYQQAQIDQADATQLNQIMVDLMMQAALAYDDSEGQGMLPKMQLLLLARAEDALIRTLQTGNNRINALLQNPTNTLKVDLIQAVLDWVADIKQKHPQVKDPTDLAKAQNSGQG